MDLVARGADDHRRLRPAHDGPASDRLGREGHGLRHQLQDRAEPEAALRLRRLLVTEVGFEIYAGDEVVARVAWVVAELERHACAYRAAGRRRDRDKMAGFEAPDLQLGVVGALRHAVPVARVGVGARPVVHLEIALGGVADRSLVGLLQLCRRRLMVVVIVREFQRPHLLRLAPRGDDVLAHLIRLLVRPRQSAFRQGRVAARAVGKYQRVLAFGVGEVVPDALLFHQPADEVEVALPVLHAIRSAAWRARQFGHVDLDASVVLKDRLQDLAHILVLEDAAVRAEREMPQPWLQCDVVSVVVAYGAAELDGGYPAVDVAELAGRAQQLHAGLRAQKFRGSDGIETLRAHQLDPVIRQAAEILVRLHAPEPERIVAERAFEPGF